MDGDRLLFTLCDIWPKGRVITGSPAYAAWRAALEELAAEYGASEYFGTVSRGFTRTACKYLVDDYGVPAERILSIYMLTLGLIGNKALD